MVHGNMFVLRLFFITGCFVALYFGLRALPDTECNFLHYEGSQITIDGAEFCAVDSPIFLDLQRITFPVEMQLAAEDTVRVGEESWFTVSFATSAGKPIAPQDLAITHTQLLHLLIVDPTLNDYHHVHPEPVGLTGAWSFAIVPRATGTYRVFAEMVPLRTQRQVVATGTFTVPGEEATVPSEVGAISGLTRSLGGYRFALQVAPELPRTDMDNQLTLRVSDERGAPVVLELVMGAFAHLVAFDEDVTGFAHLHPKYTGHEKDPEPQLAFVLNTAKGGYYRVWAQLKIQSQELFVPFDLIVAGEKKI